MSERYITESLRLRDRKRKKEILPIKILAETFKFGTGFYVGFMDGQGMPIEPITKYALLLLPTTINITVTLTAAYGGQKILREVIERNPDFLEERLGRDIVDDKRGEVRDIVYKLAHANITPKVPRLIATSASKTAIKTGIGYVAGYSLAKLFW